MTRSAVRLQARHRRRPGYAANLRGIVRIYTHILDNSDLDTADLYSGFDRITVRIRIAHHSHNFKGIITHTITGSRRRLNHHSVVTLREP